MARAISRLAVTGLERRTAQLRPRDAAASLVRQSGPPELRPRRAALAPLRRGRDPGNRGRAADDAGAAPVPFADAERAVGGVDRAGRRALGRHATAGLSRRRRRAADAA